MRFPQMCGFCRLGKSVVGNLKKGRSLRSPDASVGAGKVLAGWLWRLMGKKVALWHAHFEVNWRLRLAGLFAHVIFPTTKDGCRVWERKVRAIGHGIDVARFANERGGCGKLGGRSGLKEDERSEDGKGLTLRRSFPQQKELYSVFDFPQVPQEPIRFLYAGKITPIKNVHVLVDAARILKESWDRKFIVDIVGPPTDSAYDKKLREYIAAKNLSDIVVMHGRVAYSEMPAYYAHATTVVNMCPTGAMDKTVLEGLASRTLAVVANDAFRELFGEYAGELTYPYQKAEALAEKIKILFSKSDEEFARMREFLHERVKAHSSLETRIPIIVNTLKTLWET
ncbi:MAG: glycosyltransferase family 4 protein [Parcubacteria group bacterium]|nr:glycosyltransferase family 4 protein [Parcubacteria group bacterium]